MSAWIGAVKTLAFEMEESGSPITDLDIIIAMTLGLPVSYKNFISSLDTIPPSEFTIETVVTRLLNEEINQLNHSQKPNSGSADPNNVALIAASADGVVCFFCDKRGHFKSDCPEKKKWENSKKINGAAHTVEDDPLDFGYD
ncbi:hypothetical protein BT96DRAFT_825099 [Gymnopus androsaceus JB14]|uniref:CCHC-type domain-containing protein n=1 Tax=Gymnopus androsaceus JB14 TaxID=1447944 RepID=A0A6A4HGX8_9AGAR|nr:hypothetical protein BT96DRAFT_825099 [Gymnopus androsaceus JB14]